jgi:hypothetical protein
VELFALVMCLPAETELSCSAEWVGRGLVWVGGHGVVELVEERGVSLRAVLFGEAEGLYAFDEDLDGVGLGFEKVDGLVEIVGEGHGAGI